MGPRRAWGLAALFVLLIVAQGQYAGGSGPVSVPVESSLGTASSDGQLKVRSSDLQLFFWSDSLGVWLGELIVIQPNRRTTNVSGALRWGETNGLIAGTENGMEAHADLRLMRITGSCSDTSPSCTTFAYAGGVKVGAFVWDDHKEDWTPGDAAWALADSCVFNVGDTINFQQGTGGSQLADNVITTAYLREQVDP